jgi:hypothetical protein
MPLSAPVEMPGLAAHLPWAGFAGTLPESSWIAVLHICPWNNDERVSRGTDEEPTVERLAQREGGPSWSFDVMNHLDTLTDSPRCGERDRGGGLENLGLVVGDLALRVSREADLDRRTVAVQVGVRTVEP